MALNLGGNYKSFFIGGPKNGRVVFVDRYYPQSYQYAEAKMPAMSSILYDEGGYVLNAPAMNIKQINYYPHRFVWRNPKTLQSAEFIVMVYDKARDITKSRTLETLIRAGRIKPYLVVDEDLYKV